MTTFWQEVLARPREVFARLTRAQRMGVLALVSVGVVVAILASLLAGRANYVLLYGGLEVDDAQKICAKLTEIGVPYRLSPDNSLVQVPEEKVADAKMQLAGAGLPKLGSPGFEIFDQNQFGVTDALFNVSLQRALQGELERSIETMNPVKKARVIVTLPAQSSYLRDQSRPTASVSLWLRPGLPLSNSEVAAIAHSVAAGVGRGIKVEDVTIVDGDARLLHPRGGDDDPMFSAAYLQKAQALERHLEEKAESQLRAAFGENRASVRVSVELDLDYKERSSQKVDPENKVQLKSVTSTQTSGSGTSGGDPSVTSNGKATKEAGNVVLHQDEESEYREGVENELTITNAGALTRMSVSVLLDDSVLAAPAGDPAAKATSAADIEKLVKNAVGFNEKRKDSWSLATAAFVKPPAPAPAPGPLALENLLPLAGHVAEGVTVLFVLLFLARLLRGGSAAPAKVKGKPAAGTVAAAVAAGDDRDEDIIDLEMGEARGADLRSRVGRFVNRHPDQAREVLVAWLKEELAS